MMNKTDTFFDVGFHQEQKTGQNTRGDVFISQKYIDDKGVVCVLSDGLGSGVKACMLATLTSTMAAHFARNYNDIRRPAQIIMQALPVCDERQISYATFTIALVNPNGRARIIEYDNPECLVIRGNTEVELERKAGAIKDARGKSRNIFVSTVNLKPGDRLVLFSDGISQSGMGKDMTPLGWGCDSVKDFVRAQIERNPELSARKLARALVDKAREMDDGMCRDDMTCGVIYVRHTKNMLVVSGPPIDMGRDKELSLIADRFEGDKAVCGGTTSHILSRELRREIDMDLSAIDPEIPSCATMDGFNIVTEGILTLTKVSQLLKQGVTHKFARINAATKLIELFLENDAIEFLVGTRINEAHQDPQLPIEIEIRRTVIKTIKRLLEEKYMKKVTISYI